MSDATAEAEAKVPERVAAALAAAGLDHEVIPCDPALADTAVFCARYGYALEHSANVIVAKARAGGRPRHPFAACVLQATMRLDVNSAVRRRLGARKASFADADETVRLTGMEIGGVTPLGLPADLPLWVDARVMDCPYVILGGGDRRSKIVVSPAVFRTTPNTEIVEGLAKPPKDAGGN